MADKSGITGPIVEQDDPNEQDEISTPVAPTSAPKSFDAVKAAVKAAMAGESAEEEEEEAQEEETPGEQPAEEKPAESAPVETETKPTETPPEVDPVEVKQFSQKDIDRIISEVIGKERKREDSALKKLRDLELAAGAPLDKLMTQIREGRIQAVMDSTGLDEETARRMVLQEEELARIKAEREREMQEREEEKKVNAYILERNTWLADKNVPADLRAFAQKYAAEIEAISDGGRLMSYSVARDYVLGQKLPEIIRAREEAAAAKVMANVQKSGTKAPVPATGKPPASAPVLTAQEKEIAYTMYRNLSKAEAERRYAQAKAQLQKTRAK